jgi:hypothetical protein
MKPAPHPDLVEAVLAAARLDHAARTARKGAKA